MKIISSLDVTHQFIFWCMSAAIVFIFLNIKIVIKNYKLPVWIIFYTTGIITALFVELIQIISFLWIFILMFSGYFYSKDKHKIITGLIMLFFTFALAIHALPGFDNLLLIDNVVISNGNSTYSKYLNLDKISAGIFIFWFAFSEAERITFNKKILMQVFFVSLATSAIVMGYSYLSNLINFDLKYSSYLFIFSITNLLFTCVTEESFFRFIQKNIHLKLHAFYAITISSLLFGLAHYGAEKFEYIIAASLAGIGYAYVYHITKSIGASILVHWSLNMVHFIFFTYPS